MSNTITNNKPLWVKIRYSIDGKTENFKACHFWNFEHEFLPGWSQFSDGFIGYYHQDALCETPITCTLQNGKRIQMKKVDGKFLVRSEKQETQETQAKKN